MAEGVKAIGAEAFVGEELQLDLDVVPGDDLAAAIARPPAAWTTPCPRLTLARQLPAPKPVSDALADLFQIHPQLSSVVCSAPAAANWKVSGLQHGEPEARAASD